MGRTGNQDGQDVRQVPIVSLESIGLRGALAPFLPFEEVIGGKWFVSPTFSVGESDF
jgi:hypothetical protein